ncbi:DNA polymerase alpha/epsilon subunit B-domain-containing protein [Lyophyllum atratum]|nr:DNA polymerase alpha/epsilon subunit B-domain-containing protein [Lyophyllum atratum]
MSSELREEVTRIFADRTGLDEKLLEECFSICQMYNLSAETLLYKWEALNFRPSSTRSEISAFTMESIVALKAQVQRDIAKENAKRQQHRTIATANTAMVNRSRIPAGMLKNANMGQRPGGVQVKVEEGFGVPGPSTSSSVVFKAQNMDRTSQKDRSYRYMFEKMLERSTALDEGIDAIGDLIKEHYTDFDLGDPSSSTDEEITVVGRIVHDHDTSATPSKLTEATIAIESSRRDGNGRRMPLRFDPDLTIRGGTQGVGSASLFPGAIVALKGKNGGGGWFLVTEILSIPSLKPSPVSLGLPNPKLDPGFNDTPFSLCIASGPYTPDADLLYKPWRALIKALKADKPTVVLLTGPFIDVQHPKIKNGETDMVPAGLFRSLFIEPLRAFLDSCPGSIAILVPSVRDIVSQQAVFPQGELGSELTGSDPRIHLLPNPCRFSLNDITFAVTSVDVVYHLRKEELLKRGKEVDSVVPLSSADDPGTDPMANTCRQLLLQRSFYPLFPVPLDVSHEVNLSVIHQKGLKLADKDDDYAPDVLVLPSRLKHFTKAVQSTTAVNPSFLIKGTYAKVNVAARGTVAGFKERITTEIVRLEA